MSVVFCRTFLRSCDLSYSCKCSDFWSSEIYFFVEKLRLISKFVSFGGEICFSFICYLQWPQLSSILVDVKLLSWGQEEFTDCLIFLSKGSVTSSSRVRCQSRRTGSNIYRDTLWTLVSLALGSAWLRSPRCPQTPPPWRRTKTALRRSPTLPPEAKRDLFLDFTRLYVRVHWMFVHLLLFLKSLK